MILNLEKFIQLSSLLEHCWRLVQPFADFGIFAVNTSDKSPKSVFFSSKLGCTTCKNDEIPV